jgi:hypothetical protein
MRKLIGLGMLVTAIGSVVLTGPSIADAQQIEGALQYPPPSVGEDAQPPPPAGMVPQIVSPRRIELGVSGSSRPPVNHPYHIHPPASIDRFPKQAVPPLGLQPLPPSTSGGN